MAKDTYTPSVIRNEKALAAHIRTVHEYGSKYELRAQSAAISALSFLAAHGRGDQLNAFFNGLRPAYQTALKLFVQENCGYRETVENDKGDEIVRWIGWLKHTNKEGWSIVKDRARENRAEWSERPEQFLGKAFYETKVEGIKAAFTDETILKALDTLIKRASAEDSKASTAIKEALLVARKGITAAAA